MIKPDTFVSQLYIGFSKNACHELKLVYLKPTGLPPLTITRAKRLPKEISHGHFSPKIVQKKNRHFRVGFFFAPPLGLPDFTSLHRDKLLAHG